MIEDAFECFFHDWVMNKDARAPWGPEYWQAFGVAVEQNRVVFRSEHHQLLFLLRWG